MNVTSKRKAAFDAVMVLVYWPRRAGESSTIVAGASCKHVFLHAHVHVFPFVVVKYYTVDSDTNGEDWMWLLFASADCMS